MISNNDKNPFDIPSHYRILLGLIKTLVECNQHLTGSSNNTEFNESHKPVQLFESDPTTIRPAFHLSALGNKHYIWTLIEFLIEICFALVLVT